MHVVGIALWLFCGLVAFAVGRAIPAGRKTRWFAELAVALTTSVLFGAIATALDFGGWRELDWRAAAFVLFASFAALGTLRSVSEAVDG